MFCVIYGKTFFSIIVGANWTFLAEQIERIKQIHRLVWMIRAQQTNKVFTHLCGKWLFHMNILFVFPLIYKCYLLSFSNCFVYRTNMIESRPSEESKGWHQTILTATPYFSNLIDSFGLDRVGWVQEKFSLCIPTIATFFIILLFNENAIFKKLSMKNWILVNAQETWNGW